MILEEAPRVNRPTTSRTFDTETEVLGSETTRWRVAVSVELVVEAEDQQAAISKAEDLFRHVMPAPPLPEETKVEVVMSLPIREGKR
jgi:hypothetical protein